MIGIKRKSNSVELRVYGFIGDGWFADVNADRMANILDAVENVEEINVRIHSPGGSVAAGIAIYNALKNHKAKKRIYIEGECCSIATVVAMAGDEIVMSPSASFMIHNPFTQYIEGGADELRAKADILDTLKKGIIAAYKTKSNLTEEEISDLMNKTTYFTPQEALEKGFITAIEDTEKNSFGRGSYSFEEIPNGYFNFNKKINKKEDKNMKKEISEITLEELKTENNELFNAVFNSGKENERKRIQDFENYVNRIPGAAALVKKYQFEEPKYVNEVVGELLDFVISNPEQSVKKNSQETLEEAFNKKKEDAEDLNKAGGDITDEEVKAAKLKDDMSDIINMANGGAF
ncbi:head maturation protease, ClpP-related [Fusobacterium hominis]|uniref:ATP-dependent Clp protease proteolytic subunit n=1 Tax=Fusobacterium hominis TaxID=2764326 RepID=A0A7G9GXH6_9FUSO|nr:head maturation protease, ClpP-related [Fusobacterium hominis]QNM15508.1 Clp protease ClpP [Fusobacterium hominis]